MSETLETLKNYLEFPAVRYAIIVGLLISLCSSLLGVTLVMKRFSFIGDGLSHVAFGAMAIATVLNVTDNMLVIMPVTVVAAVLLLRTGQNTKIKGDAAVAMISVGGARTGLSHDEPCPEKRQSLGEPFSGCLQYAFRLNINTYTFAERCHNLYYHVSHCGCSVLFLLYEDIRSHFR